MKNFNLHVSENRFNKYEKNLILYILFTLTTTHKRVTNALENRRIFSHKKSMYFKMKITANLSTVE